MTDDWTDWSGSWFLELKRREEEAAKKPKQKPGPKREPRWTIWHRTFLAGANAAKTKLTR